MNEPIWRNNQTVEYFTTPKAKIVNQPKLNGNTIKWDIKM
jgi:hypothetical protein